ncbi:MAG: Lrp/AsnC family transcriptional regulator [Candidatus Woesearchaeota archaeon]
MSRIIVKKINNDKQKKESIAYSSNTNELSLDLWDKKILTALNEDVRASYSEIAKKTRLSKEVVNYRINRLIKQGIIREFVTIFGFGYWSYKILIDFSKITHSIEKNILSYLSNHPNVNWLTPCSGGWDLVFSIMAQTPEMFDMVLREILGKIGEYIRDYKVAISTGSQTFGHTYILGSIKEPEELKRLNAENLDFDSKDKTIAKLLHKNARISLTEIYKITGISIDTIRYRIRKMEENSIIKRYRLILDSSKLGYTRYEIFLRCINLSDIVISKFKEYSKQNPNVEFFSKCVGSWDIELTVHFKTSEDLRKFILEVKERFGEYIQRFETITLFNTYNFVYLPKELQ